jgi:hypothetical protein
MPKSTHKKPTAFKYSILWSTLENILYRELRVKVKALYDDQNNPLEELIGNQWVKIPRFERWYDDCRIEAATLATVKKVFPKAPLTVPR